MIFLQATGDLKSQVDCKVTIHLNWDLTKGGMETVSKTLVKEINIQIIPLTMSGNIALKSDILDTSKLVQDIPMSLSSQTQE